MTSQVARLFCLVLVLVTVNAVKLPSYFKVCSVKSKDFKKCAIESGNAALPSIVNGDKKFGIPKFNPLHVSVVEFSSGDLKLNATDVYIHGFPEASLTDFAVDKPKKFINMVATIPEVTLDLNYNVGGKIVSLPLEGHGKGKINLSDAIISYNFEYEEYEKDGEKYLTIKKDDFDAIPKKFSIQLDNLFNGNPALGESTNKLLNENWQEVLTEFKPALKEIFGKIIRSILDPIVKKVPVNEIFADY